ncbi:VCBS repeat-containing protein [Streptomyces gardneri]|uniref:FG-GAP repeat domain-containing protein n=1 Tax=Streptomyces gardneri TaxID=66892 RepID=UPI0006BDD664|nr:VCBS repeat-containing protein [Streptomyces gardneri]QPK47299.1 VCBS repeat-containing protein [Streptomyces gardneri]WRK38723.1 VCBS repeat-containing protein [Streptomyces venezuelae]CUM39260.1 N-acetylmuramoyl-L-alanine amidase [Streptomyces venezuelae]
MQNRCSAQRRRHLAAAVTAVLAITVGTGVAAGPVAVAAPVGATAAASSAAAAAAEDVSVPFPVGAKIAGAGATGFLTRNAGGELHWTRYETGISTEVLYAAGGGVDRTGTDILVVGDSNAPDQMRSVTLRNMAVPGTPSVHFDLGSLWARYVEALGPNSVLAKRVGSDNTEKLLIVTDENGIARDREVTGLPADASGFFADAPVLDGKILVGYETGSSELRTNARAVIDVTTGAVVETYPAGVSDTLHSLHSRLALSATHVAWTAFSEDEGIVYITVDRRTRVAKRHVFPITDEYFVGLAGNWLVYGSPSELTDNGTFPNTKIQAVDLTAGPTSEPVDIAAYANSLESAGDGSLLVRGGTVEQGEGLFKVSSSAGGELAVEKVATTEQPTALTYLGSQVPAVIDFDRDRETELKWRMSRLNADVHLKLTHKKTGQTFTRLLKLRRDFPSQHTFDDITFGITWQGLVDDLSPDDKSAFNGDYTWEFRAVPQNGIGPEVKESGTFKVVRSVKPHDYSDNGSPDLFARDLNGSLWRFDSTYDSYTRKLAPTYQRSAVGPGWNTYDRIESVGNVAGTNVADVIARDKTGVLWLYQGTGDETKPLGARTKIGPGWGVYNHLAGGSDLTGDGKADLVATDKAGDLYLYKGTGSATTPFGARKKLGGGWGGYNQLTAVGNLAGGPAGDLLARDTAGVLWLHLGKGDGTFATRVKVGAGWGGFTELIGFGDANKDGRTDLYAWNKNGPSYFYAGTGNWAAPFAGRADAELLKYAGGAYQHAL